MRAVGRAGRFTLLLAALLLALGVTAPPRHETLAGHSPDPMAVAGTLTDHDVLDNRSRRSGSTSYAWSTSPSDTSWGVHPPASREPLPQGLLSITDAARHVATATVTTPQASRAPPRA